MSNAVIKYFNIGHDYCGYQCWRIYDTRAEAVKDAALAIEIGAVDEWVCIAIEGELAQGESVQQ